MQSFGKLIWLIMKIRKKQPTEKNLNLIGSACLFVNGIIFLFYALLVPTYVRSVHGLITLAAVLFAVAILPLYYALRRVHKLGSKVAASLFGIAIIIFIVFDLLLTLSSVTPLDHAIAYVAGNLLFIIGILVAGVIMLKGVFYKWVGYLSIVTGILGLVTNLSQAPGLLSTFSLLLLGVWSLAVGFNIKKLAK